MPVEHKGDGKDVAASRLQDSHDLAMRQVGIGNVLENIRREHDVESRIRKTEALQVLVHDAIHQIAALVGRSEILAAPIAGHGRELIVDGTPRLGIVDRKLAALQAQGG